LKIFGTGRHRHGYVSPVKLAAGDNIIGGFCSVGPSAGEFANYKIPENLTHRKLEWPSGKVEQFLSRYVLENSKLIAPATHVAQSNKHDHSVARTMAAV
jgi:hypothetical protein